MSESMKSVLKRVGRGALSLLLAGVLAKYGNNPIFLAAQPLLSGLGVWLRRNGIKYVPI